MPGDGVYFDGETAVDHAVSVTIGEDAIEFHGDEVPRSRWRFGDLAAIEPPSKGHPFRMSHAGLPGARLILRDAEIIAALAARAPHLQGGINPRHIVRIGGWIAASLLGLAATAFVVLQLAPQKLAFALPDSWRNRAGEQIEATLTSGAKQCAGDAGRAALSAMLSRLAEGIADMPAVAVKVYDVPVMNAFAMPGERIVLTGELIARAGAPEEVAGVLAHELGHVVYRHSEAQLIRATGLDLLMSLATGGGGGNTLSSIAGLAAILRYSRGAEAEADEFALAALEKAAIDPLGLKHFFELVLKQEGRSGSGAVGKIEGAFATHPGTAERIDNIHPLPAGSVARPVLDDAQWQALKAICATS